MAEQKEQSNTKRSKSWLDSFYTVIAVVAVFAFVFWVGDYLIKGQDTKGNNQSQTTPTQSTQEFENCDIKGNISQTTGEKIYHLPEDRFYDKTEIDETVGEKYFCTEQEAEDEGWRRSEV